MFYAQFVLSKKGPLAKVWLAAHWEKKLSKAQIYETNLEDAVNEIKEPKMKIALRTTGHLLLGLVRIHSKKAKYLLADCNEAFFRIKEAFRTNRIELIEDTYEAPKNAITLPEVGSDFDSIMPEIQDIDLNTALAFNQSRIDDITLKDDFLGETSAYDQSGFGLDDFGDGGMSGADLAAFGLTEDDVEAARDHTLTSLSLMSRPSVGLREQTPCMEGREAVGEAMFNEDDGNGGMDDMFMDGGGDDFPLDGGMMDDEQGDEPQFDRDQSVVDVPDTSFALAPLTEAPVVEKPVKASRRKRRLIIDETKFISSEEMKSNMADWKDTITELSLAPPTRRLMKLKESGNVEKLFQLPCSHMVRNKGLVKQYQARLGLRSAPSFPPSYLDSTMGDESVEDLRRELEYSNVIEDDHVSETLQPAGAMDDFADAADFDFGGMGMMGNDSPMHDVGGMFDEEQQDMGSGGQAGETDEANAPEKKKRKAGESSKFDATDDDDHGDDEKISKRNANLLSHTLARVNQSETGQISFNEMHTKGATKKSVAMKFYSLLVLNKKEAITTYQAEPYGDIIIKPGPNAKEFEAKMSEKA